MSSRTFFAKIIAANRSSAQVTVPHELVKVEGLEDGDIIELRLLSVKKAEEVPAE